MPKKSLFEKFNFEGIKCNVKCVNVYDGDTITLEVDFRELLKKYYDKGVLDIINSLPVKHIYLHCRMAGYNSAEISRCSAEEKVVGLDAKKYMTDLILGKELWCHFLAKQEGELIKLKTADPYGRPIIDLYNLTDTGEKNNYINKIMVDTGHAAPYDGHGEKKY